MFRLENSCRERFHIVIISDGYRFLKHDWAAIQFGRHEMNGRPGPFHTMLPGLVLRVRSGE